MDCRHTTRIVAKAATCFFIGLTVIISTAMAIIDAAAQCPAFYNR